MVTKEEEKRLDEIIIKEREAAWKYAWILAREEQAAFKKWFEALPREQQEEFLMDFGVVKNDNTEA